MEIKRELLVDQMPGLYAVGQTSVEGRLFYAAASENRNGRVVLVDAQTLKLHEIEGGLGGVMAVLPDTNGRMLCIEEFYPVFDSATAKVIAVDLENVEGRICMKTRTVSAKIPYVHRIGLIEEADGRYLAAGRLCQHKSEPDDWSTAGTLEIAPYQDGKAAEFSVVCDGIFKHHAMFIQKNSEGWDDLFYGGTAGTFRTLRRNGKWETEKLIDIPTSDIVFTDLDGDGVEELAIIEEFHGENVAVFKKCGLEYVRQIDIPVHFGHVLWGGMFLGRPGLIAGSRSGEKELTIYRFGQNSQGKLVIKEKEIIDRGQAPAQILVNESGDTAEIIAANHGAAQLVRYRFQQ